jgi:hypothetical protein
LPDGDSLLLGIGETSPSLDSDEVNWGNAGVTPDENGASDVDNRNAFFYGDWVQTSAVPDPPSIFSEAVLLLPFGVGAVRMLRKKRAA